jgi:hypothetical protein
MLLMFLPFWMKYPGEKRGEPVYFMVVFFNLVYLSILKASSGKGLELYYIKDTPSG